MKRDPEAQQLYEAFGELLYMTAMADGIIQLEELDKLDEILQGHPWAEEIKWSFNYETKKHHSIEYLYKKVVDTFEQHGPFSEYQFFVETMEKLAESSNGIDTDEDEFINEITRDIATRLKIDLEKINRNP